MSVTPESLLKIYVRRVRCSHCLTDLHERCPICSAVIKKEGADFIVLLSSTDGKTDLSLFETASGSLVKQTTAETLDFGHRISSGGDSVVYARSKGRRGRARDRKRHRVCIPLQTVRRRCH